MKRTTMYRRGGFTLLEVMLVIGILAMLAVFVVPAFLGQREKANEGTAQSMVGPSGPVATALGLFFNDFGKYPERLKDLIEKPDYVPENFKWKPYMETLEFKDPWGNELVYLQPGKVHEDGYDLLSMGPDGKEGTDDDVTNFKKE
ncbi:MAG: Type II secretion system protein G [Phycisphaerae bacterium]|nr:Type II secretion system protein G [Phycisphaerae bacterium]